MCQGLRDIRRWRKQRKRAGKQLKKMIKIKTCFTHNEKWKEQSLRLDEFAELFYRIHGHPIYWDWYAGKKNESQIMSAKSVCTFICSEPELVQAIIHDVLNPKPFQEPSPEQMKVLLERLAELERKYAKNWGNDYLDEYRKDLIAKNNLIVGDVIVGKSE